MNKSKLLMGLFGGAALLTASIAISALSIDKVYADVATGKDLFFNSEDAECNSCHKLMGKGGSKLKKEPDLSNIGSHFTRDQIYEKVSNPCKYFATGFRDSYEEEVMPREFLDLIGKEKIGHIADFLATMKDTSVDTPKPNKVSAEDEEEFCE